MARVKRHMPQVNVSRNNSNSLMDLGVLSFKICTITNLGDVLPQIFLGCCTNPTYFLIGLPAVLAWVLAASVLLWRVMAHPPLYYNYILYAFVIAFNCGKYGLPAVSLQLYPVCFCYCIFNSGKCEMDLSALKDFGPSPHFKALLVELGGMNVVYGG